MQRKIVLTAMLLMAVGLTLFMSGFVTGGKQAELRITAGDVLYNATLNIERFGCWAKEIKLDANTTLLISINVTGWKENEEMHCIDLYVLNNASYFTWSQKHAEHKEQASWFKWEESLKYVSETVDKTGNYVLKINRTNTYYFILDNSGRCSKKVSFKLLKVEGIEAVPSRENGQPAWMLAGGIGLLTLGLILLLYGLSSKPKIPLKSEENAGPSAR
ncbi:MAG: hypothetical protein ACUVUS_07860 [Thermoproteota archaeon]